MKNVVDVVVVVVVVVIVAAAAGFVVVVVVVVVDDDDNYNNMAKWALFCPARYILNDCLEGASSRACDILLSDRKPNAGTRSLSKLRYLYVALSSGAVNPWLIICFGF